MAQTQNKTGPRIDTKGAIVSTGIEVLLIENAVNEDQNKQFLDQEKLEYCTKVLLASMFISLPSSSWNNIHELEIYIIQISGK